MIRNRFGRLIILLGVLLSVGISAGAPRKGEGTGAAPGTGRDIAVEAMRSERRAALVIGNGAYRTSPLRNPVHDARAMARALREAGFEVLAYENLSQKEMKRAILNFRDHLRGGVGLFYFAGHDVQVNGRNYLIPIDVEIQSEEEVEVESVDVANVLARMETAKTRLNIVILDACWDNPFGRSFRSSARGLASIDAPTGTIIAYATAPGKVARDGEGQNGLYTGELLKAMRVPGLKIEEVFKRARQAVRSQTRGEQVPWESSSMEGDFMFVLPEVVAAVPPPPKLDIREEVQQRFGSLAIRAKVPDVEVWLDDQQIGKTKAGKVLVVEKLPAGAHRVKASKGGYKEWEGEVEVAGDARAEAVIDLELLPSEVPAKARKKFGMTIEDITPEVAKQLNLERTKGVLISEVEAGGAAQKAGLRQGDVILELNRWRVENVKDYKRILDKAKEESSLLTLVQRGEHSFFVHLRDY